MVVVAVMEDICYCGSAAGLNLGHLICEGISIKILLPLDGWMDDCTDRMHHTVLTSNSDILFPRFSLRIKFFPAYSS